MSDSTVPQEDEPHVQTMDIDRAKAESHFAFFWKRCHEGRLTAAEHEADVLKFAKEAFMVGVSVGMRMERDKHE